VFLRSTADLAAEGERRHFVAISVPVVQQLLRAWHCAVQLQIGLRYATAEESRPWRGRCQVIPANHHSASSNLLWWSVVLDADQPAAGEPIKDWSALVCFWSTTASDPDLASTYRQYLCAACRPYPLFAISGYISTPTLVCEHVSPPCSTTSDSECSALSSTTRPADTNPCFGCMQGWLLLFRAGWCLRSSTGQAAVHPQRCRPTRVLSQALGTHHPASPLPSLVAGPGTDSIPSLRSGIPMSQWISAAISRWERSSDSRCGRSSSPPLIYHHDACCPVSAAINSLWPFLSCLCIAGMKQLTPSELFHPSPPFGNNWRHICLGSVLVNFLLPSSLLLWLCKVPLHRSRDSVT